MKGIYENCIRIIMLTVLCSDNAGPVPCDNLPFPSVPARQEPHSQTHDSGLAPGGGALRSTPRLQALLPVRLLHNI